MSAANPRKPGRAAHRLGVCSWSLQPRSHADLIAKVRATGLDCVQLALAPFRPGRDERDVRMDAVATAGALRDAGIEVRSGMMSTLGEDYSTLETIQRTGGLRPDATWVANLAIAAIKFLAAYLSDSTATLAEAVHSVADSGNQALLFVGLRLATRRDH